MAASKALFLLAVLAAAAVLATTAEQTHENNEKVANNEAGVKNWRSGIGGSGGYGYACEYGCCHHACEYGCCHHVFHGGCKKCCPPPPGAGRPEEVKN